MTRARKELISLSDTRYYHCIARCVRRAFLCGSDHFSGQSFEHRRQWIVDRLFELSDIFAIDVAAYAVMSNHYHVVLQVNAELTDSWSQDEVIERWRKLFKGPQLVEAYLKGAPMDRTEFLKLSDCVEEWRARLKSISWLMRCLNEHIARKANEEDGCKGRFWEGRFKSQALLDEAALLTCMTYVDLNPIRAGIAKLPEASDYTSIQERIENRDLPPQKNRLVNLVDHESPKNLQTDIQFHIDDYLTLVDWTGRAIREDKNGAIPAHIRPILERIQIDPNEWCDGVSYFGYRFPRLAGKVAQLERAVSKLGQQWCRGRHTARKLFLT
ncbi:transposase [Hahella sp. CCB-MM4]|uniref:transposase n=1 Tax=Hahella sp. (strain CCB-MM4) TaxID=1926491 RepID=UPI000B9B98EC|nr:transposase [Hahella sp. CCB-MM4]OZG69938.1 transposase [Hahella sp. CCB-MM4]